MGPVEIKKYIYNVMTSSRELANFCQESVNSFQSKKMSDALNNFHLKTSIDFIIKSLTDEDKLFVQSNEIHLKNLDEAKEKPSYIKVINYIELYLKEVNI